jgi:signal transduction histidine kinase
VPPGGLALVVEDRPGRKAAGWIAALLCVAVYIGLNRLGVTLQRGTPALAPWNPAAALIIVFLLLRGFRWLPLLLAGACVGAPDLAEMPWQAAQVALYAIAAWLLRGPLRIDPDLQGFDDVFRFVAVASIAAVAMALLYALRLDGLEIGARQIALLRYWLADMIGLCVIGPLLLAHRGAWGRLGRLRMLLRWEVLAQAVAIVATLYLMFPRVVGSRFYPMFIPLVWVAARHGLAGVAAALLPIQLCFLTAMVALDLQANQEVKLQILMLSLALTGLLLGAVISERERARAAAIESESRLKAMRADLDRRRHEIEHASRSSLTGELAAALAHELNQPLAAIVNYIGACQRTLLNGDDPSQAINQMTQAAAQAERAGQIIRRLREFFCNAALETQAVPVIEMIDDLRLLMEDEAVRAGAAFEVEVPPDLVVAADRLQVTQVLINLARNSLDALSGTGPARRVIRIVAAPAGAGFVRVSLQDSGPGISQEVSVSLFSPFTTTRSFGMGLGLSISRSIIEAHGGQLWVGETADEEGALFHFTLPIPGS